MHTYTHTLLYFFIKDAGQDLEMMLLHSARLGVVYGMHTHAHTHTHTHPSRTHEALTW